MLSLLDFIQGNNQVQESLLEKQLQVSILFWLKRIIEDQIIGCQNSTLERYYMILSDDEDHLSHQSNELIEYINEKVQKLDKCFLIHFDEIQDCSVDKSFKRKMRNEKVGRDEIKNYILIVLTETLYYFKDTKLRFILSGTDASLDQTIRLSSSSKIQNLKLKECNQEFTLEILSQNLNIKKNILNDEKFQNIVKELSGCARSIQYFLDYIELHQNQELTLELCKEALNSSFRRWADDISPLYENIKNIHHVFDEILFLIMYHESFEGVFQPETNCIIFQKSDCFPKHWDEFIKHGILRVKYEKFEYVLYIPTISY